MYVASYPITLIKEQELTLETVRYVRGEILTGGLCGCYSANNNIINSNWGHNCGEAGLDGEHLPVKKLQFLQNTDQEYNIGLKGHTPRAHSPPTPLDPGRKYQLLFSAPGVKN